MMGKHFMEAECVERLCYKVNECIDYETEIEA